MGFVTLKKECMKCDLNSDNVFLRVMCTSLKTQIKILDRIKTRFISGARTAAKTNMVNNNTVVNKEDKLINFS